MEHDDRAEAPDAANRFVWYAICAAYGALAGVVGVPLFLGAVSVFGPILGLGAAPAVVLSTVAVGAILYVGWRVFRRLLRWLFLDP